MSEIQPVIGRPEGVSPEAIGFLSTAIEHSRSIRVLGRSDGFVLPTMVFLRGWTVEFALKAYLAHKGVSVDELKDLGHDLLRLWQRAVGEGLPVSPDPPGWCSEHADILRRYRQGRAGNPGPVTGVILTMPRVDVVASLDPIVEAVVTEIYGNKDTYSRWRSERVV